MKVFIKIELEAGETPVTMAKRCRSFDLLDCPMTGWDCPFINVCGKDCSDMTAGDWRKAVEKGIEVKKAKN